MRQDLWSVRPTRTDRVRGYHWDLLSRGRCQDSILYGHCLVGSGNRTPGSRAWMVYFRLHYKYTRSLLGGKGDSVATGPAGLTILPTPPSLSGDNVFIRRLKNPRMLASLLQAMPYGNQTDFLTIYKPWKHCHTTWEQYMCDIQHLYYFSFTLCLIILGCREIPISIKVCIEQVYSM